MTENEIGKCLELVDLDLLSALSEPFVAVGRSIEVP